MAIFLLEERNLKELQTQYAKKEYEDFMDNKMFKSAEDLQSLDDEGVNTPPGFAGMGSVLLCVDEPITCLLFCSDRSKLPEIQLLRHSRRRQN